MSTIQNMNKLIEENNIDRSFYRKTAQLIIEIECLKRQLAKIIKNTKIDQ